MGPAEPSLDGSIVCSYCGFRDTLPADELSRALELKRRLAAANGSVANVQGMESALSEIFEKRSAYWSAAGIYIIAAVLITANSVWQAVPIIRAAPPGFKLGITINALMGGLWVGGFAIALLVSFAIGRRVYRRRIRSELFARIPRQPGLPARCRACDGDLPNRVEPFIQCGYCSTKNLVTPELQANHSALLDRERAFYSQRTGQAIGAMRGASLNMSRVLIICGVITYVALLSLAYLAATTFPTG